MQRKKNQAGLVNTLCSLKKPAGETRKPFCLSDNIKKHLADTKNIHHKVRNIHFLALPTGPSLHHHNSLNQIENYEDVLFHRPMCSWCYGFSPTINQLKEHYPNIDLQIISGGFSPFSKQLVMMNIAGFLNTTGEM